jgi:cyanate permease
MSVPTRLLAFRPRRRKTMRILIALICLALAAVCGFGLMASMEPGTATLWKVGYGGGAAAFLIIAFLTIRPSRFPRPTANDR